MASKDKRERKFSDRLWVKIICWILAIAMVAGILFGIIMLIIDLL